jgi:hypothetical protein
MADSDLEIEAEIVGKITFNEPFDFKNSENQGKYKPINKYLVPSVLNEIDILLAPLFKSMKIEYRKLPIPKEE